MCRSIKVLRRPEAPATSEEVTAAARQFVRKVSGMSKPSKLRQAEFDAAISEIAGITERYLTKLRLDMPPRPRSIADSAPPPHESHLVS